MGSSGRRDSSRFSGRRESSGSSSRRESSRSSGRRESSKPSGRSERSQAISSRKSSSTNTSSVKEKSTDGSPGYLLSLSPPVSSSDKYSLPNPSRRQTQPLVTLTPPSSPLSLN